MPTCNGNGTVRAFIYPYANSSSENEKANYVMGCVQTSESRAQHARTGSATKVGRRLHGHLIRRILRWVHTVYGCMFYSTHTSQTQLLDLRDFNHRRWFD